MNSHQIHFKSLPEFFAKEEDGTKPNTVRRIDMSDRRFWELKAISEGKAEGSIVIQNSNTGRTFERKISNVYFWNDLVIISWIHNPLPSLLMDWDPNWGD